MTADADERMRRALALMRRALDVTARDRAAWLERECGDDVALRHEVRRLLDADASAEGPLDRPLASVAAASIEASPDPRIGRRVGPFVLRALLGRGGMGSVYRAERSDGGFAQTVALKLLRAGDGDDVQARRRFARERQILVRLQHPHIARFLDGGVTDDGQPWYAMELVEGESLVRHLDRIGATIPQRIALLLQVCDAVQFAHQNLVLHRDLKPANILVDAQGQVKLLDFGIATLLVDDTDPGAATQTRTELSAFTPDYAAPEQIEGGVVSTATDIYALGVLAFELFTGQRPFRRGGMLGLPIAGGDIEPPSRTPPRDVADARRRAALRGDLDTLVLTCLQRDPARRYASAAALARDLERHLGGLPIEARPDSFGYRSAKFLRRHRIGVATGGALLLALMVATAVSVTQAQRAERESARASALAATAQRERDAALDEVKRQETLREHFVVMLNRATADGAPIAPDTLLQLASDPALLGRFGDPRMNSALQLALSDLFLQRGDFPRTLELLDALEPALQPDDDRTRMLAALNRADATLRIGRLDETEAALATAERHMSEEQRERGMPGASLLMIRGQLLRARGDQTGATAAAREASRRVLATDEGSPLARGSVLGSGATALLLAGDLDAAIEISGEATRIWREAGVSNNVYASTVASQRANALFLRGDLLAAQAAFEAIDAGVTTESPPAHAARDNTHAKLLALLAEPDAALAMIDRAAQRMCEAVGAASLDCLRLRLSRVDTCILAGHADLAATELAAIGTALQAQPPLQATGRSLAAILALQAAPDDASALDALLQALRDAAGAGALQRRTAVRALLMLSERLAARGPVVADTLAGAALDLAGDAIDGHGMDASLLALWRARLARQPLPPDALAQLARAIGANHPVARRWSGQ